MISIDIAQDMQDQVCRLCRRLNPQHADCNWCQATEACREAIKGLTEDPTKPAIRTQAQLMQEWGQERFATALGALSTWVYQLGHPDPYSTEEIRALQDASDDAFQLFSTRSPHLTPPGLTKGEEP